MATVNRGDGTTTTVGTIVGHPVKFEVNGCHSYKEPGTYKVNVTITEVDNTSNTAATTSKITCKKHHKRH